MNIDSSRGIDVLMTEAVVLYNLATAFCAVESAGFPGPGGQNLHTQNGDQYILRFKKADYSTPAIHQTIVTTNYGTLEVKQIHPEGDHYAIRATGKVSVRA